MKKICAAILLAMLSSTHASELDIDELKAEVIRISKISSPSVQQSEITKLVASFTAENNELGKGDWQVRIDKSPIDDSKTIVMSLKAQSPIRAWVNDVAIPELILRFKEGRLESYFSLGVTPNTERGDSRTLTLRFDSDPAKDVKGSISTDKKAVFLENSRQLIRELSSSKKLTLRFTPFNSNPVTTTFDLDGFAQASNELLAAANIDLNDKGVLFEDEYKKSLQKTSMYSSFGISVKKNVVTIKTEGGRWKPFARTSAATDLISTALKAFKELPADLKYKVTIDVNGSSLTTKQTSDGGVPFSSSELQKLLNQAIEKAEFNQSLIIKTNLKTVEPNYYGKDAPSILVGKVKDTNESIILTVEIADQ